MKTSLTKYLPVLIVLFVCVVVYQFGISRTIELYQDTQVQKEQLQKALTADAQITRLEQDVQVLTDQLSEYTIDSLKNKEYIFHALAEFCKNYRIELREFPVEGVSNRGDYSIETNKIVAEGQYGDLLRLLHFIEFKQKIGRVSSVSFYSQRDHKKQRNVLLMNIYIQTIGTKL